MPKKIPLKFPPGISNRGTTYQNRYGYTDSNLVRFVGDAIDPVGGWEQFAFGACTGIARSFFVWTDNSGKRWLAIGTTKKLYVTDGTTLYDITPAGFVGPGDNPSQTFGYGTSLYGIETYGQAVGESSGSTSFVLLEYGFWHFDAWGQNLVANIGSDGRVLEWTPGTAAALAVSGAPVGVRGLAVSQERHLIVICESSGGNFYTRRVKWCSQEDNTAWTPSPTNTAGDFELQTDSLGVRILRYGDSVYVFTLGELHKLSYIGTPYVFNRDVVETGCGIINPGAVAVSATAMFWLSPRGFFQYDGSQVKPVVSAVEDLTDGRILAEVAKHATVAMGHNEKFNSFICFLPDGADPRPVRYVEWDYLQNVWTVGKLDRSAWGESFIGEYPVAAQPYLDGATWKTRIYQHEKGWARPNLEGPRPAFCTGQIEIGAGDRFVNVLYLYQDVEGDASMLRFAMTFLKSPNGFQIKTTDDIALDEDRGYTDCRGTGRAVYLTVTEAADAPQGWWRWGEARLEVTQGEGR